MESALCISTKGAPHNKSAEINRIFGWIYLYNSKCIHFILFSWLRKIWQMSMKIMQLKLHKVKTWTKSRFDMLYKFINEQSRKFTILLSFLDISLMIYTICLRKLQSDFQHQQLSKLWINLNNAFGLLHRYWPRWSWNITFRWTAKRVIFSQEKILSRGKI